ncbi:hypothetical protein [Haloimpatiens massiliensis]|uniref:hypothetical protein n=1 Tax=Haloimpatiens massiliensis TaxID=1658110 RepID=UPI000C8608FB|nr:hypothetical protein [Haloimpatiens massiliensis]
MKITAEFNSNEELISFINTFGANALKLEAKEDVKTTKEVKKEATKEEEIKKVEEPKEEVKKQEVKQVDPPKEETKKEDKKQDTQITKETIRAAFAKLIKAGKANEAKEITAKHGAKKVPDLKEEDYAEVLKEVEELL